MAALTNSDSVSAVWKELATDKRAHARPGKPIVILGVAFLLSVASVMVEKGDSPRDFYERCIDREIARYESAERIYSAGTALTALNKQAMEKVRFFKVNRNRLITSMEEQGLGKDPQRVEYFLHQAARNGFRVAGSRERP